MKKTAALASALRSTGARIPATGANDSASAPEGPAAAAPRPAAQPSRKGTKPITVHHPEEVRRQLKTIAAEQGRNVDDVVAEAFNLLFAKYRRPEIAPRKTG